jgi:hypothetical protein
MQDMGKLIEEMTRKGQLIRTAGLRPTAEVCVRGGKASARRARVRLSHAFTIGMTDSCTSPLAAARAQ